jgi:competence ComEA-like helix-hairpin-helix protein
MRQWLHEIGIVILVIVVLGSVRVMLGSAVEPIQLERTPLKTSNTASLGATQFKEPANGQENDWWCEPNSIHSEYTSASTKYRASKLDVNRATVDELKTLKGIGDVLARRIIEDRAVNGFYYKPEDLMRVKGIATKKLDGFRNDISP